MRESRARQCGSPSASRPSETTQVLGDWTHGQSSPQDAALSGIKAQAATMSALPPKADMCSALGYVRFGPKADIGQTTQSPRRRGRAAPVAQ